MRIVMHRLYGVRTSVVYDVDGVAQRLGSDLIGYTERPTTIEAMRESELAELKKDVESLGRDAEETMRTAEQSMERDLAQAQDSVETAFNANPAAPPADRAGELPAADPALEARPLPGPLNGGGGHAEPTLPQAAEPTGEPERASPPQVEKSGA